VKKIKIIALFGKSSAGKDTIQKWVVSKYPDIKSITSCTTRPKRDYEQDDIDYHFLTTEQFTNKVLNGEMLEATEFRGWFYGTSIDSLDEDKLNIGSFNPAGIDAILKDPRLDVLPIYVSAPDKIRLLRSLQREKNPDCHEICRRFFADIEDFQIIDDFDYSVVYNNTNDDTVFYQVENEIVNYFDQV